MAQTVNECLTAALDSVSIIDGVKAGTRDVENMTQTEINEKVKRNVDHLEIILTYDGTDDIQPDIVGSSDTRKIDCSNAIITGQEYISANT